MTSSTIEERKIHNALQNQYGLLHEIDELLYNI